MKTFLAAIVVLMSTLSLAAPKVDEKTKAEMGAKMAAAATPGEPHKKLAEMAGDYNYTGKYWEAADVKPFEGKGTASMKMLLGGRWLQNEIKGEAAGGMPAYEGLSLTGYNNVTKEYQTLWVDSMSTGATIGGGQFDASGKTLKDQGRYSCPLTGKPRDYRAEWLVKDKNTLVYSMYGAPPLDEKGKEFKMMELTLKRK